jgi:hypothetical protein
MAESEQLTHRPYRLHRVAADKNCVEVVFPYEVVEKAARKLGLTVDEFLQKYHAVARFDREDSLEVVYAFEKIEGQETAVSPTRAGDGHGAGEESKI